MTVEAPPAPPAPPRAKPVEHGYPSPQAARCTVCGNFSWLCPHPWELREPGAEWEAFALGRLWNPPVRTAPESARASAVTLEDSEKFPVGPAAPVVAPEPMRARIRIDDAPPTPPRRQYLCGCAILFSDPWIWKIHGFPASHQQGCLYAENKRFVAALRERSKVVEAPQDVIERPVPKMQKRVVESLALELPK